MRVKATQRGQYGHVREIGEEFEVPEGTKGSWFEPVQAEPEPVQAEPEPVAEFRRGRPPKS